MTTSPLNATRQGIAIIDGLDPCERSMYQDTEKLKTFIGSVSRDYLGPVYNCNDRSEYFSAIDALIAQAREGHSYVLHLECHGCQDGIEMGKELVTWAEQQSRLALLNSLMNGELVINLSACNGIYGSKMAGLQSSPTPFYAVIGPAKKIEMTSVNKITSTFYAMYLADQYGRLDLAIDAANRRFRHGVLLGLRSEVFFRLHEAGFPFRPNAQDDEVVKCNPDGTVSVSKASP